MRFNNKLAILLVCLVFAFVFVMGIFGLENQVVTLACGVFLAKLSDVVQFYFRTAPPTTPIPDVPPAPVKPAPIAVKP